MLHINDITQFANSVHGGKARDTVYSERFERGDDSNKQAHLLESTNLANETIMTHKKSDSLSISRENMIHWSQGYFGSSGMAFHFKVLLHWFQLQSLVVTTWLDETRITGILPC